MKMNLIRAEPASGCKAAVLSTAFYPLAHGPKAAQDGLDGPMI